MAFQPGCKVKLWLKVAWNFDQEKLSTDTEYQIGQRHTEGSAKYDQFLTKKMFVFVATDAMYDWEKNLELRYTATAGTRADFGRTQSVRLWRITGHGRGRNCRAS